MLAKIVEISTITDTPLTYVLIHIWSSKASYKRGSKPSGDNAFVMDLVAREDTPSDICRNIEEYLSTMLTLRNTKDAYPPFHAKPNLLRGGSDPRGVLAMTGVQALLNGEVTVR